MTGERVWKSPSEESSYRRLEELAGLLSTMGQDETSDALSALLEGRVRRGRWNWDLFEYCVNCFESEYAAHDPTYRDGINLIRSVLDRTFELKRRKGKRLDLFEVPWTADDETSVLATLGIITERAQDAIDRKDVKTAVLLSGLAHIIRYEIRGDFARRRIESWASPTVPNPKDRAQLVHRFLNLKRVGTDGKADTFHIRNAFAHGHFGLFGPDRIELWDIDDRGNRTYSARLTAMDMLGLSNLFEKKLKLVELYPSLLASIDGLCREYKREWRIHWAPSR